MQVSAILFLLYNKTYLFWRDKRMITITEYSVEKLVDPFGILMEIAMNTYLILK